MIRALVFDLGGVLVRLRPLRLFLGFLASACDFGGKKPEELLPVFKRFLREVQSVRGLYLYFRRRWDLSAGYSRFVDAFNRLWIGTEMRSVTSALRRLKGRYRLWMLSNTNDAHVKYIGKKTRIFPLFDRLFFSYRLKMLKPSARLYRLVNRELRRSGVRPPEVLYVDDAPENRAAARKAGWRALAVATNRPAGGKIKKALGI